MKKQTLYECHIFYLYITLPSCVLLYSCFKYEYQNVTMASKNITSKKVKQNNKDRKEIGEIVTENDILDDLAADYYDANDRNVPAYQTFFHEWYDIAIALVDKYGEIPSVHDADDDDIWLIKQVHLVVEEDLFHFAVCYCEKVKRIREEEDRRREEEDRRREELMDRYREAEEREERARAAQVRNYIITNGVYPPW